MKVLTVLLGTIIGAGFISGAEINLFFNSLGLQGMIGILFSSILLGIVIYFSLINENKSYNELVEKNINSKIIRTILLGMINLFLIISYFIMVAGLSSFFCDVLNLNYFISSLLSILIIFIIVNGDISRIENFNKLFIPFLILLIFSLFFVIKDIKIVNEYQEMSFNINFLILGLIYASYNSISLIPITIKLKENNKLKNKGALFISIIFSLIIFTCGVILFVLLENNRMFAKSEIPLLDIVNGKNEILIIFVRISIAISIISTAVSLQYAAIMNIEKNKSRYTRDILIMNIVAIIVSRIGFQRLIKIFYPLFGLIGTINLFILMKNYFKYSKIKS